MFSDLLVSHEAKHRGGHKVTLSSGEKNDNPRWLLGLPLEKLSNRSCEFSSPLPVKEGSYFLARSLGSGKFLYD